MQLTKKPKSKVKAKYGPRRLTSKYIASPKTLCIIPEKDTEKTWLKFIHSTLINSKRFVSEYSIEINRCEFVAKTGFKFKHTIALNQETCCDPIKANKYNYLPLYFKSTLPSPIPTKVIRRYIAIVKEFAPKFQCEVYNGYINVRTPVGMPANVKLLYWTLGRLASIPKQIETVIKLRAEYNAWTAFRLAHTIHFQDPFYFLGGRNEYIRFISTPFFLKDETFAHMVHRMTYTNNRERTPHNTGTYFRHYRSNHEAWKIFLDENYFSQPEDCFFGTKNQLYFQIVHTANDLTYPTLHYNWIITKNCTFKHCKTSYKTCNFKSCGLGCASSIPKDRKLILYRQTKGTYEIIKLPMSEFPHYKILKLKQNEFKKLIDFYEKN